MQELIVKYIRQNPGCIKRLYDEFDRAQIDESVLLNPEDWYLDFEEGAEQSWVNESSTWNYGMVFDLREAYPGIDQPENMLTSTLAVDIREL